MIGEQLAAFLHSGVGIHLGSRNDRLQPNGARAISLQVLDPGDQLVVFMADIAARRVLPDLKSNGYAAVVVARPTDERACQVKGTFVRSRRVTALERTQALAQWNAFLDNLEHVGIPRASARTWISVADVAITLRVTGIYEQTPGPDAGKTIA
jgi:hypothetical protein